MGQKPLFKFNTNTTLDSLNGMNFGLYGSNGTREINGVMFKPGSKNLTFVKGYYFDKNFTNIDGGLLILNYEHKNKTHLAIFEKSGPKKYSGTIDISKENSFLKNRLYVSEFLENYVIPKSKIINSPKMDLILK